MDELVEYEKSLPVNTDPNANLVIPEGYAYFIVNRDGSELGISEKERDLIVQNQDRAFISVGDILLNMNAISQIMPAEKLLEYRHLRKGDWLCRYGTWHSRKEADWECTCGRAH